VKNSVPVKARRTGGRVEILGISKRFKSASALVDINLVIEPGMFFSLLGPSGCGKTTLLRILAGLEMPDEGRILLDGRDITHEPPERRPFNIVFQRYALFPHLTVHDNVAYGLTTERRNRPSDAVIDHNVDAMLSMVGLEWAKARYPGELSGGQAQRVALVRALVRKPDLLLLDEPLSALDRNVRHQMREELLRIHAELTTTFLLVTHDQDEALSMSDQIALMNMGKIEQVASPATIYRSPATLFAARFMGAGSFVRASLCGRSGGRIEAMIGDMKVRALDSGVGKATRLQLLVRPEEITIVEACHPHSMSGQVETRSFFGSHYEVTVRYDKGLLRVRTSRALDTGEAVCLAWPDEVGIAYADE